MAITRLSTAAVSHVVQPRFEPPETTKCLISIAPLSSDFKNFHPGGAVGQRLSSQVAEILLTNKDGGSAWMTGVSSVDVRVEYLDAGGNPVDCTYCNCDDTCGDASFVSIKYVQVGIENYQHTLLLPPPFNVTIPMPAFETTLPRESLGIVPGVGSQCTFG